MTDDGELAGLDDIDWAGLSHAYGSAADVPGLLRGLTSPDAELRKKASSTLHTNIFHQSSRYEASAYAVPFLLALAADPGTPDRPGIVRLIGALAIGYDESHLPAGVDIEGWRRAVAERRTADPDAWVAEAADDAERRHRETERELFDSAREAEEHELAAYDAVRAGVPVLCALLGDPDPAVRAVAAWAVGWFPEESAVALPRLLDLLATERVPGVAANAIVAAGLLGDASLADRLRAVLTDEEPLSRWAAATALARVGVAESGVIAELAIGSANPPEQGDPRVEHYEGDLRGFSSQSLARLDGGLPDGALAAVLHGLARASGPNAFAVTAAALQLAFGDAPPQTRPGYADLTEPQRRTVRVLAQLDEETWRWVNFTDILRTWRLPDTRLDCRRYAGLPEG